MKNEIEKRQREDDNNAKAIQSTQESLEAEAAAAAAAQNGTDDSTEATLTNGNVNNTPTKLVAC